MSREDDLYAWLAAVEDKVPEIGIDDCGPWVMRWVESQISRHVPYPAYTTRKDGYRIAARAGGLVRLADDLFSQVSLFETYAPRLGDPCVIALGGKEIAAIVCNIGYAMRGEAVGYKFSNMHKLLKAWALPNGA